MSKNACLQIPVNGDDYSLWIEWHKSLKRCVGKTNANQLWMMNFNKEAMDTNTEMRNYMRGEGVDLDRSVQDRLVDWGGGVYNWFSGALDFTSGTTVAIVFIIVGGAGLLIYNIARTTDADKAVRAGMAYGTKGMSEMGGGMGMPDSAPLLAGTQPQLSGGGQKLLN